MDAVYGVLADFQPYSSGQARNRILVTAGGSYARRLHTTENTAFSYVAEIRPVVFVADPIVLATTTSTAVTGPSAGSTFTYNYSYVVDRCQRGAYAGVVGYPGNPPVEYAYTAVNKCGWRWTFGKCLCRSG